ncbi:MAG TPA: hypothetical protein VIV35_03545 [Chitinophagaceae bacterium]
MEQNQNTSLFQLNLDAQNSYTLRSAASWGRVLGIVGIILGILFVILGIMVQQAISRYGGYGVRGGISAGALGNAGMAIYLVIGLVMIISSIFALNAGSKISLALKTNDQAALNGGFAGIRNYFAIWSIVIIILLLFLLIGVLGNLGR